MCKMYKSEIVFNYSIIILNKAVKDMIDSKKIRLVSSICFKYFSQKLLQKFSWIFRKAAILEQKYLYKLVRT